MSIAYRIVEVKNNLPHTLFHGIPRAGTEKRGRDRSRQIPTNCWIQAEKKMVRDGSGPYHLSGFNVILTRDGCEEYLERFTKLRTLKVVSIHVRGELRAKESSQGRVMLADEMYLPWDNLRSAS